MFVCVYIFFSENIHAASEKKKFQRQTCRQRQPRESIYYIPCAVLGAIHESNSHPSASYMYMHEPETLKHR